jgi:hypothetical protein
LRQHLGIIFPAQPISDLFLSRRWLCYPEIYQQSGVLEDFTLICLCVSAKCSGGGVVKFPWNLKLLTAFPLIIRFRLIVI